MMGLWIERILAFVLLASAALGVYLEAGVTTAAVVVLLFLSIAGLDKRTRPTEDPLEAVKRMVEELGAGSSEPGDEEEES